MCEALTLTHRVTPRDFTQAGDGAARIKHLLKQAGLPAEIIRRAAVIAYEAELNLVIHSDGGSLSLFLSPQEVCIETRDEGPGIPNIALAMQEGWSTAGEEARQLGFGAGMGLPNIKKNSDEMEIHSESGTHLLARIRIP